MSGLLLRRYSVKTNDSYSEQRATLSLVGEKRIRVLYDIEGE